MWGLSFIAVAAAMLFLYVPGFLVLRGLRVSRIASTACAPLASLVAYNTLCIAYSKVGMACSWELLVAPSLLVGLLLCITTSLVARKKAPLLDLPACPDEFVVRRVRTGGKFDWACLALYVVLGIALALYVLARSLDGPESFVQEYDNVHHLGVIHGFVTSGDWSMLGVSLYPGADALLNPLPGESYYPTAWHCLAALLVDSLAVSVPLAANAVNFVFVSMVMPISMFFLLRFLFARRPGIVLAGSLCALASSSFPWWLLVFGPLYPNMASFSLVPAVAACFMGIFSKGTGRASRVLSGSLFCLGLACFVFVQPLGAFATGVFLVPFCIRQAIILGNRVPVRKEHRQFAKAGLGILAVAVIAAAWLALYKAPFLQSLVTHSWPAPSTKPQALVDVLFMAFRTPVVQITLAALVVAGAAWTLRHRQYLWLSCSYALACFIYLTCVATDLPVRFLLAGFWYTDSYRIAAFAAMFAIPLASIGLWLAARGLAHVLSSPPIQLKRRAAVATATAIAALAFVCANYYPSFELAGRASVATAFGAAANALSTANDSALPQVYDAEEADFVQEVMRVVPEDALLLNEPDDGSAFAYGADGLHVYYRYLRTYGSEIESETSESVLVRTSLNRVASDERVQEAVQSLGAEYLLLLDQGSPQGPQPHLFTYEDGKLWKGIESINDSTPGFEVVLKCGDMRLYRITAV